MPVCEFYVSTDLLSYVSPADGKGILPGLQHLVDRARASVLESLGVRIPSITFKDLQGASVENGTYLVSFFENPIVSGRVGTNGVLFRFLPGGKTELEKLQVQAQPGADPGGGSGWWVAQNDWAKVEEAGSKPWEVMEYPVHHLQATFEVIASELFGHQELLGLLQERDSKALAALKQSPELLTAFTQVMRGLLAERVPIKPVDRIWDRFIQLAREGIPLAEIIEEIRYLPDVRTSLPGNSGNYNLYATGELFESEVRKRVRTQNGEPYLEVEYEEYQRLITAVRSSVAQATQAVLLIDDRQLRAQIRRVVEVQFPNLPVLSRRELLAPLESRVRSEVHLA
jgi:type III secretory pathway component EscV